MKIIWTPQALQDRTGIWEHIHANNPRAAARMDQRFCDAVAKLAKLAKYPMLGQSGKIPQTRELIPHQNYRLVYETHGETVWLLALVHTARQWPPIHEQE